MPSLFQRLTRRKHVTFDNSPLTRALTGFDLTALGIGSTVGVGFYVLAGEVARNTAGPAVTISFLIAAIASLFSGLCYAEFGARVPKAGSSYVYSYVCIGEFVAFVIGWNLILEYVIGTASVARGYSGYVNELANNTMFSAFENAMPIDVSFLSPYPDFFAFSMTLVLSVILCVGVKESSRANNLFTGVNIFVIIYTIIAGSTQGELHNWHLSADEVNPASNVTVCPDSGVSDENSAEPWGTGGFAPYGFEGIMQGAATCFYGFVGFDVIATAGEEALNPEKSIPISIVASLLFVFCAYFGMSTVITLALPYCMEDPNAPLIVLFDELGMDISKWIVSIGALFGFSASLMGAMFPMPRVIYAMADDGLLFRFLSRVSKRFKTPVVATVISGFLAGTMALLFTLSDLVDMMSIGTLMAYTIVCLCVMLLRYADLELNVGASEYKLLKYSPDSDNDSKRAHYQDGNLVTKGNANYPNNPSFKDYRNQLLNFNGLSEVNELSSAIVTYGTLSYSILSLLLACLITVTTDRLVDNDVLTIAMVCILAFVVMFNVFIISRQPESKRKLSFKSPLVPWLPALGTFINWYLMCNLPVATWTRFAIWMALGLLIYFLYGIRQSSEEQKRIPIKKDSKRNRLTIIPPITIEPPTPVHSIKKKSVSIPPVRIEEEPLSYIGETHSVEMYPMDTVNQKGENSEIIDGLCTVSIPNAFCEVDLVSAVAEDNTVKIEVPQLELSVETLRIDSKAVCEIPKKGSPPDFIDSPTIESLEGKEAAEAFSGDVRPPTITGDDKSHVFPYGKIGRPPFLPLSKTAILNKTESNSEPGTPFVRKHPFKILKKTASFDDIPPSSPDSPLAKRVKKFIIIPVQQPTESLGSVNSRNSLAENTIMKHQLQERLIDLSKAVGKDGDKRLIAKVLELDPIRERGESKLISEDDLLPIRSLIEDQRRLSEDVDGVYEGEPHSKGIDKNDDETFMKRR